MVILQQHVYARSKAHDKIVGYCHCRQLSTHSQAILCLYKKDYSWAELSSCSALCSRVSAQPSVNILAATKAIDNSAGDGDKEGETQLWVIMRGDTQAYTTSLL